MSQSGYKKASKTMNRVNVIDICFVTDDSGRSAARTEEVRKLIAQMINLSHKRGRPSANCMEDLDAA